MPVHVEYGTPVAVDTLKGDAIYHHSGEGRCACMEFSALHIHVKGAYTKEQVRNALVAALDDLLVCSHEKQTGTAGSE